VLYLGTASGPKVRDAMADKLIGQMITPKAGNRLVDGAVFAIDNGCVSIVDGRPITDPRWDEDRWLATLDRYQHTSGCLFAVVPDIVSDAAGTNERWARYHGAVRDRGYRAAYVTQNGCESIPASAGAVFVGGDDAWKEGRQARRLTRQAQARGLWCHMGRVNTLGRLRFAALDGYDSVDGTGLAFGPDRNLPQLLRWLYPAQPSMFGGVA
jgi:hypothetical protein